MYDLFLGAQRKWVLVFVFVMMVFGTRRGIAEPPILPIDVGPTQQADLLLEFSSPPPATAPCCEVSYSIRVVNQGPDSTNAWISLDFLEGTLGLTMGCLNDLEPNGVCELGPLNPGESRPVSFRAVTTECDPTSLVFRGLAFGPVLDPIQGNHELTSTTAVGPDLPPMFVELLPESGTTFDFDSSGSIDFMATVIDAEEPDDLLTQQIQWRSDRVIQGLDVGSPINVPMSTLGVGGHTITATVADRCNNTVSAETAIGIIPGVPIAASNPVELPVEGEQGQPDIASIGDDAFVVVWSEIDSNDFQDTDGSVRAQRFDSDGQPLGGEIQVNLTPEGLQHRPSVAGRPDGSFTVAWQSSPDTDPDSPSARIFLRQFDNEGVASDELPVTLDPNGGQYHPDVASRRDGSLLVAWESFSQDPDGGVVARFFDDFLNGPDEFQVNSLTTGMQRRPSVLFESGEGFLVAWQSQGSLGNDDDGYSIQARRFDENLVPVEREVQVNQVIEGDQTDPSVAGNQAGAVVIVWKSIASINGQKRTLRIAGGRRDVSGGWSPPEFDVFVSDPNGPPPADLSPPDVAMSPDGDFVVIWAEDFETDLFNVLARPVFGLDGSPAPFGDPLLLDSDGLGLPAIAYNHSDSDSTNFFAFWETKGEDTGTSPEGFVEAMDIAGNELSLAFPLKETELAITAIGTPDPVVQGRALTFNIEVENRGPAPSVATLLKLYMPNLWTFFSFPGCAVDAPSPNVICQLDTLPVGETWYLALSGQVHPDSSAQIRYMVEASSATPLISDPVSTLGIVTVVSAPEGGLFFDGFESGNTAAWATSIPFVGTSAAPQIEDRP